MRETPEVSKVDVSPGISRRAALRGFQQGIELALATLLTTARLTAVDEVSEKTEQEAEPDTAQMRYLKQWMQTPEAEQLKNKLEKAILDLENPVFEARQQAKKVIKELTETLRAMIFPFPEELRHILGEGIFPSDRYGRDFRGHMCDHHRSSVRQAYDFDAIQEMMRMNNHNGSPHIMPGEYTPEELQQALEAQIGLRVRLAHSSPAVGMVVTKERNEWGQVLQDWSVTLGGWGLDYSLFDDAIYLEEHPNPNKQLVTQGPNLFIQETFPGNCTNCTVMRVPTIGEFFQSDGSLGNTNHYVHVVGIGNEGTLEKWLSDYHTERMKGANCKAIIGHSFSACTSSARRTITLPVGGEAQSLGRHQHLRTYILPSEFGWTITIETRCGEEEYMSQGIDPVRDILWKNRYEIYDANGKEIRPNAIIKWGNGMGNNSFCEFLLDQEPTHIRIKYIPDVRLNTLRLPEACLPKDANQ